MAAFSSLGYCFIFIIFILFSVLIPFAASLSFNFTSFDANGGDVRVQGDASVSDGLIQLTVNRGDKTQVDSLGRAIYPQLLPLWDKTSGEVANFSTRFSFIINSQNRDPHGDGFAFFLAHKDLQITKEEGSGLGLVSGDQILNSTIHPFVAVEFDTFPYGSFDPPFEHVGIDINSMKSSAYVSWCSSALNGTENEALIVYNSASKDLNVSFFGFCNDTKFQQNLHYKVDLKTILPESVTFGFSAATGHYFEIHTIKSWNFSSSLKMTDNNLPEPPVSSSLSRPPGKSIDKDLVVGLSVAGGVLVLVPGLGLIWYVFWKNRKEEEEEFDMLMDDEFERGTGPKKFLYNELVRATNNFAEGEKLGEGGFGGVYKGFLKELNTYVAVKRVSKGSKQGVKEYASEVRVISRLRHKNLVQLIGWCHERRGLFLVYEFMSNGSLDYHLFKGKSVLSWAQRFKIVQGLASVLFYLHEEWEQCVVHRDIKASNIMLDSSFTAKLGDFGLARFVDHAKESQTTILAGTLGYMAPECYVTGKASKESDIYSFGVVVLEIASGRKPYNPNVEESERVLVQWVWELHGTEKLLEAADPRLHGDFHENQMKQLMIVGLWCIHPDYRIRPSIRQAIQALNGEASLPVLPMKMPVPTYASSPRLSLNTFSGSLSHLWIQCNQENGENVSFLNLES